MLGCLHERRMFEELEAIMRSLVSMLAFFFFSLTAFDAVAIAQAPPTWKAENAPILQLFQGDGEHFVLREPLRYVIKRTGRAIIVPEGFVTDFASVPKWGRAVISPLGRHSVPAIVHDFLYWEQKCTREQADLILYDAMEEYKSTWFEKHTVYRAVRLGGQGAWDSNAADRKQELLRVLPPELSNLQPNTDWKEYRQAMFSRGVRAKTLQSNGPSPPPYCLLPAQ
jgi:hypothetical protein